MGGRTLFLPLAALYPECQILTRQHPAIRPLACIEDGGCHLGVNARCTEALARRTGRLFDHLPGLEYILVHWPLEDAGHRGIAFDRSLSAPRVQKLRAGALLRYLAEGQAVALPAALLA